MMRGVRGGVAGGALLVLGSPVLAGLGAQAKCEINDSSPYQVNGAKQYVITAASSRRPDEIPKHLSNAIRVLTDDPSKIKNEAGRQYMLLRAYAQWLQRDDVVYVMKRGDVGFTANPGGSHNLLMALDSAATVLESMLPQCRETVRPYRDRFFNDIMNKSIAAMNAESGDSAVTYARLALQLHAGDPRPWNVLSALYQKAGKPDSAMLAMDKVIQLAGTDTLYRKVKQQSRYNLAVMRLQQAEGMAGDKAPVVASARGLLEDYLKDSPGDANATQALGRAMRLAGDTASVADLFNDLKAHPEKFTADQLFEAASNAAASGRDADASVLFENGLKKNPYHRTALYNYANVLFGVKDADKMGPVVERLLSLDPNFDRAWRLMAGRWQLKSRAETDAARRKAYNDSTLKYLERQQKLNPRVEIALSARAGSSYAVQGSVTNEGTASASWTMQLELLDEAGTVVATKAVAIGPLDAGANTMFSVKIESPKAVAFRYAPLK